MLRLFGDIAVTVTVDIDVAAVDGGGVVDGDAAFILWFRLPFVYMIFL